MKSIILILSVTTLMSSQAFAESRERMNGATQIEREIRWSWKYLKNIVHSCLESKTECQQDDVRKVLLELDAYLPDFKSNEALGWGPLLTFVSEQNNPGVFTSVNGDAHRLAITGFSKNSGVMINQDRMNRPIEDWVGILAHEATHHLGYVDDAARLPDRLAAEITNHFKKRQSVSTLAQFQRPDTRNVLFNPTASGLTVGFFSSSDETFDIEWGSTPLAQMCQPTESIAREFVGNPVWTIEYMKKKTGVVTLRGGGFVNVMCRPKGTTGAQDVGRRALLGATLDLQYAAPLDITKWRTETPEVLMKTVQIGASMSPPDGMWGPNQSFWVTSVVHESGKILAGQTWKTDVVVKSADGYAPKSCEIYLSGSKWPHAKHMSLPMVDIFNQCTMTKIAADQYRLTATYQFPANMQPDDFYISLIRFPDPVSDRFAFPQMPSYVNVESSRALKPATIKSIEIKGLQSASAMQELVLTNSYQATGGQKFQLELSIEGDQDVSDVQVELPLWVPRGIDGRAPIFANGPAMDFKEIFSNLKTTKVPGGSKLLIDVVLPSSLSGYPVMAMRFARIFVKTSDFSYAEYENPIEVDGMIVNSQFAK